MESITKKQVQKAAEELNEVLGLEPEIDVEQDLKGLSEEVLAGADLMEPDDDLSNETLKVLEALEQGEDIVEEDAPEEEEDEIEEEEAPAPPPKKPEPKPEKEKAKPKPPAAKPTESTRLYAAGAAIKEGKGKGKTIPDLVEQADQLYVKSGGSSNLKESGEAVRKALQALAGFGAVKVQDKGTVE